MAKTPDQRRRRIRLLKHLSGTTHSRGEADLEAKFGSSVHAELKQLFLANHIEADLGAHRRWRLTVSGRSEARRVLSLKKAAA